MSKPNRQIVKLGNLHQLLSNPRTDEAASDKDAISKLYTAGHSSDKNLINLALEIADYGFDENEPIYVVERESKEAEKQYDVYEGNRRLAALNLLNDPEGYSEFLHPSHLSSLQKAPKDKLPSSVEVTVVDEEEAHTLMERNHGGALDGYGRIAWSAEAQRRYARSKGDDSSFVGRVTPAFEDMYGQPVGGYIGGITTADRLFNNKKVQEFIGKIENDSPTDDQLSKIKTVLDEAKQVAEEKESAITRVFATKKDIEEELLPRILPADLNDTQNSAKPIKFQKSGILTYVNEQSVVTAKNNYWINQTFAVFQKYWTPDANQTVKHALLFLFAPATRSIFELSFDLLRNDLASAKILSLKTTSTINKDHIKKIVGSWRNNNNFLNYVSAAIPKEFDSAQSLGNILIGTDFANAWSKANPGAHTGAKHLTIIDLEDIIQKAEIFALLSEHFQVFANKGVSRKGEERKNEETD